MSNKQKINSFLVIGFLVVMVALFGSCRASGGVSIGDRTHPKTSEPVKISLLLTQVVKPIV
jgi:hypothetical protein